MLRLVAKQQLMNLLVLLVTVHVPTTQLTKEIFVSGIGPIVKIKKINCTELGLVTLLMIVLRENNL